ncbi:MAG: DUF3307 domain-containing protein [Firmicutes bacterium]|jgi:hypothetical protein|nr:DUF3307 domain-containing protein [Bacillota bacterium]
MFKLLFGFFLTIHLLGDFYFQSDKLSEKKRNGYCYVLLHGLIYFLISFACAIPFWSIPVLLSASALAVLHFVVDSIKFLWARGKAQNAATYIADQIIHLGTMFTVASLFVYLGFDFNLLPSIGNYLAAITENPGAMLGWIGLILAVHKPANITIKQLVAQYKPAEEANHANRTGAFIGTVERFTIILLLSVAQYSAIGLVLTAKSVARYKKIAEEKQFAEYYLLGTLLSTLLAIAAYLLFV